MINQAISHYKILEKLGQGGMGEVFLAEDTKLKRKVALKFLPKEFTKDKDAVERFQREAQAAATLNHPNIVTIYEINQHEDQTYIAMEHVEGQTLKDIIQDNSTLKTQHSKLALGKVIDYATQICDGLQKAHEAGIVHRDIKPQNILIDKDGRVKILDFGLAKLKGVSQLTKDGSTLGTLPYMSPEQIQGQDVNQCTDIWSLGVVIYEMITGELPFSGEYEQAIMYSILNEKPKLLKNQFSEYTKDMQKILLKAIEKNEKERYQQVEEISLNLKKIYRKTEDMVQDNNGKNSETDNSIAVLPFVNMSADPENEFFSDGLTEELINAMAQLKDLRVVARTSSFVFKGKDIDIREIGKQLNVKHVLEGSVRKSGKSIRITAQLINVEDGYHLWSERYDRDLEHVFVIQDEIAREIASKLKTTFRKTPVSIAETASPDMGAYELYLKGRHHFYKFSPDWINQSIDCFSKAIAIDPNFAPAYAGLADSYIFISTPFGSLESGVAMPKANEAAKKARSLDPNLSEAYVSLGAIATFYDWDSKKAHQHFQKAIELNPNNINARLWYEFVHSLLDQNFDEALTQLNIALNLDPLNLLVRLRIGYIYIYKYDFKSAARYFKQIINNEPENAAGYHALMDTYGNMKDYASAINMGEMAIKLGNYAPAFAGVLGVYCARGGKTKRARELLAILLEREKKEYVSPFWIAVIYMGLNEKEKMYKWFDKALTLRDGNLLYIFAPPFDSIRKDQRFKDLRKKMGFKK